MERSLLLIALALAGLSAILGLLVAWIQPTPAGRGVGPQRGHLWAALGLPVLLLLATLPSSAPFQAGQALGKGFLLGAVGALVTSWMLQRTVRGGSPFVHAAGLAGAHALAVVTVAIPVLLLHLIIVDALVAVAIGWFCSGLLLWLGVRFARTDSSAPASDRWLIHMTAAIAFAVLVSALTVFATYREAQGMHALRWSAAAICLSAAVPVLLYVVASPVVFLAHVLFRIPGAAAVTRLFGRYGRGTDPDSSLPRIVQIPVVALLLVGLATLVNKKLLGSLDIDTTAKFTPCIELGLVIGLVAWWLSRDPWRDSDTVSDGASPNRRYAALAGVVCILGAFMFAFHRLAGFGVATVLLAAWPMLGLALTPVRPAADDSAAGDHAADARLLYTLMFGVLLVLYRVYAQRYSDSLLGSRLDDHYAVFGLLLGSVVPPLLAGFVARRSAASPARPYSLWRLPSVGLLALAVPGLVLVLWGADAGAAMCAGLGVGAWISAAGDSDAQSVPHLLTGLMAMAVALAMDQWAGQTMLAAEMTRTQKAHLIEWVAGAWALYVLLSDYVVRIPRVKAGHPDDPAFGEAAR